MKHLKLRLALLPATLRAEPFGQASRSRPQGEICYSATCYVLLVYTLLPLILTYPLLFHLTTTLPNDIGDPLLNTWIMAWDSHALLTDPLNLFNANIFYPLPQTLTYSEHLFSTALLAWPVQLVSGEPVLAYNLTLLASFPLTAFGMYLLALRWTRRRDAAFIAGLIFAFNPYRFAAISHIQLLTFQWLPLALALLDIVLTRKKPVRLPLYLALGLFLWLQILASWYLAVYTALILGGYLVARLWPWWRPSIAVRPAALLLATLLLVTLFTLPFAIPYLSLMNDLRAARPLSLALSLAAAPLDLAAAAPFNRLFGPLTEFLRARPGFTEENMLFVGLVAPVLALVGVAYQVSGIRYQGAGSRVTDNTQYPKGMMYVTRSTLLTLLVILMVSLALTFPAPYAALAALFPPSTVVRVPPRWIIPALFALSGLASFGYQVVMCHVSRITYHVSHFKFYVLRFTLLILVSLFLLAESLSLPLPLAPVGSHADLAPAYHWLAGQPGPMALVELPLRSAPAQEYPEVKRMYASTLGWWGLVNGYSGYTPPRQPQLAQALTHFPDQASLIVLQGLAGPANSSLIIHPSSFFFLVHPDEVPFDRSRWETADRWRVERNPALYPIGEFQGDYLYRVLPLDPNRFVSPLATFGPDQNIYLLAIIRNMQCGLSNTPSLLSPLSSPRLALYWQPTSALPTAYTVFIHLRAADGFVKSQADGPPVSGHYPTTQWLAGEVVQDIHLLPEGEFDHFAIGLYDPATGERLPAFGPDGQRLAKDAVIVRGEMLVEQQER